MPHSPAKPLQDIVDAGRAIQQFVAGRTLAQYRDDLMLRSAVERQFEIIGEAMNRLDKLDATLLGRIERPGVVPILAAARRVCFA